MLVVLFFRVMEGRPMVSLSLTVCFTCVLVYTITAAFKCQLFTFMGAKNEF